LNGAFSLQQHLGEIGEYQPSSSMIQQHFRRAGWALSCRRSLSANDTKPGN
jgi:hypothetical protein